MQNKRNIVTISFFMNFLFFLVASIFLFAFFSLFVANKLEANQQQKFDATVQTVVENNDNSSLLNNFEKQGYTILIFEDDILVYPVNSILSPLQTILLKNGDENLNQEKSENRLNDFFSKEVIFEDKVIIVTFPRLIQNDEIIKVLLSVIPIVFFAGIVISLLGGKVISNVTKKEMNKTLQLLEVMKKRESKEILQKIPSSNILEVYNIENEIKAMYDSLLNVLKTLKSETAYVKKIEKEKQLFVQGITHELKTPLMSMRLIISELLEIGSESEESIVLINNQIDNITQLINELLFLYKEENNNSLTLPQSIREVLDETINDYQILLEDKQMRIKRIGSSEFLSIVPVKIMKKVLSNLMSNAIKYGKNKSDIIIEMDDTSLIISNIMESNVEIDVKKLTAPFVGQGIEKGSGLGLYFVSKVLEKYNYLLNIELSESRFIVRISIPKKESFPI